MQEKLIEIVNNFEGKKIGVIGDLMLDRFIFGDTERISPEAPVPVVLAEKETIMPGGAANVANNIGVLGGEAYIIGTVGKERTAKQLIRELMKNKIDVTGVISFSDKPTIQKIRIIARGQQIVRIDKENKDFINKKTEKKIISFINSQIKKWDALIISDYAKGLITEILAKEIINLAKKYKKPIVGDAKNPDRAFYLKNVNLLTPNLKEAEKIAGVSDLKKIGDIIQKKLKCNVLITRGAEGMTLFEENKIRHFPTKAREVFDASGAGDTAVAALVLALISGANLKEAAIIANHAAGIAVGKIGTATVSIKELKKSLEND